MKQRPAIEVVKKNGLLLLLSGAALGFNWIFLFEAYRFTSVSNATVSYYFAPIFVILLAPFLLKEKLTREKVISVAVAMIGLFLIVNNGEANPNISYHHIVGICYGLIAAGLYAGVILMNKFITGLSGYQTTLIQLMLASLVMFPYVLVKEGLNFSGVNGKSIILLIILGIIHTGVAYYLYFSSIQELKGQTIAVLSYIDPISAIIFAFLLLGEGLSMIEIFGGLLILGSTFISEKIDSLRKKGNG
jgi:RarD protein